MLNHTPLPRPLRQPRHLQHTLRQATVVEVPLVVVVVVVAALKGALEGALGVHARWM